MTHREELSALQVTSQEHTWVDTSSKAEQLLPDLGNNEREGGVKQLSQSLCLYLYLLVNDFCPLVSTRCNCHTQIKLLVCLCAPACNLGRKRRKRKVMKVETVVTLNREKLSPKQVSGGS